MSIEPFTIPFDESVVRDLRQRLALTRTPEAFDPNTWDYGTNLPYMKDLLAYWKDSFDWKQIVAGLNALPHRMASIDDQYVHFVQARSDDADADTVVLLHGWPDSFVRFIKILPLLTKSGEGGQSFNVVVPSLPGFGFSSKPISAGWNLKASAQLLSRLMERLGCNSYIVLGGDGGSPIAQLMAAQNSKAVRGVYLNDVGLHKPSVDASEYTEAEANYLQGLEATQFSEGGYAMIQMSKPQTLAYGLHDSPAGLAAWIVEKFYGWSDHEGDIEQVFTKEELLTNIMIYWVTQTIGSSIRGYREEMMKPSISNGTFLKTPTGFGLFPKEAGGPVPMEYLKRGFNVVHRTEFGQGGHFTAMEQPDALDQDFRSFAAKL